MFPLTRPSRCDRQIAESLQHTLCATQHDRYIGDRTKYLRLVKVKRSSSESDR
ncbi:hypothetical protein [Coleofasciculus sp. H7-2]|uniref:hypothetical protein n=1 Tax=Coleofasciculus sp. H7-2 TaxID=3351545 RepID=UPI00366A9074